MSLQMNMFNIFTNLLWLSQSCQNKLFEELKAVLPTQSNFIIHSYTLANANFHKNKIK